MVQILVKGKIYTVDGEDAALLREAVATLESESTENKAKFDAATQTIATLNTEKTALDTKANTLEADLTATKTKLDEATTQLKEKTDEADGLDVDELIQERLKLWSEVLPVIRKDDENYKPNYGYTPLEIKVDYLFKTCADKADVIKGLKERKDKLEANDPAAIAYVDALFTAFAPGEVKDSKPSHTDSVLDSIMYGRHFGTSHNDADDGVSTGKVTKIDYREEARKKVEAKNPQRRGRRATAS